MNGVHLSGVQRNAVVPGSTTWRVSWRHIRGGCPGRLVAGAAPPAAQDANTRKRPPAEAGDLIRNGVPLLLVPSKGFEPSTFCSGGRRSIP